MSANANATTYTPIDYVGPDPRPDPAIVAKLLEIDAAGAVPLTAEERATEHAEIVRAGGISPRAAELRMRTSILANLIAPGSVARESTLIVYRQRKFILSLAGR